jgi:hypothetical protein
MENSGSSKCAKNTPAWIVWIVNYLARPTKRTPALGIGTTYDPRKMILEILAFYVAFHDSPWPAVAAIITVGFGVLRVRDLQIHPAKGDALELTNDTFAMAALVAVSQLYFVVKEPVWATPNVTNLMYGLGLSIMLIFTVRALFHLSTPANDPHQLPEFRLYRAALRINVMAWLSVCLIAGANLQAVPGSHNRDFLVTVLIWTTFAVVFAAQKNSNRSVFWEAVGAYSIFTDPVLMELDMKTETLPKTSKAVCFQAVFVMSTVLTLGIGLWRWAFGDASQVHWPRLASGFVALIILMPLWRIVAHLNAVTAERLSQSAKERRKKLGGGEGGARRPAVAGRILYL